MLKECDRDLIGRVLAVMSQRDFGLEFIEEGPMLRLRRPPVFGFRAWRAWFEFCRPATDKRQAHRHTVGRIPRGTVRAPSRILGELSQTKVPGEPLVIPSDGTWRPFLPLPDDLVSAVNQSLLAPRPTRLYSSEGVTEITVNGGLLSRVRSAYRLTKEFPDLAELRNWTPDASIGPRDYLEMAHDMGLTVRFRRHQQLSGAKEVEEHADESVTQFFPALLAIGGTGSTLLRNLLSDYAYYFGSAFENSLTQLVTFTTAVLGLFLTKHATSNLRIWLARKQIGLIVGGWGTRGKSGTERLKAALFNAMGHPLVSKTTGCEAMFIQAHAYGDPLEIPLYRPGDKATIWEQSNLLRFAARLCPSVFLWECMALTPDYVDVLQRQWTQDDLSTITNTYPDHEDLQGPSGYDVATTISGFVPHRAHLITTEQQMRPLLEESCRAMHTSLRGVGWLESGLITNDLLDRFPYREHPDNIALVSAMADELGCDHDYAVKAMADRLIPDLGVLKTHPTAQVQQCRIEFSNGMSANERFGAMGNWVRLGYDRQDAYKFPDVWVSVVINNRADRVARSRVFAHVMVNDIQVDRYFLIGGNLKGLQGFVAEAWQEYADALSLRRDEEDWDLTRGKAALEKLASRFRVPHRREHLAAALLPALLYILPTDQAAEAQSIAETTALEPDKCVARLQALDADADLITQLQRHHQLLLQGLQEYEALVAAAEQVAGNSQVDEFGQRVKVQLKSWFDRKVVVIENYDATGDEVIQRIVDETPPGYLNRVMGMQNIKGTGLDFVYRFHAWDTCEQACNLLASRDQETRKIGLATLDGMPDIGILCHQRLQEALDELRHATPAVLPDMQIQLESIQKKLTDALAHAKRETATVEEDDQLPTWLANLVHRCEQWMEIPDAARRRQKADQIYRDLSAGRIGRLRAVEELRKLNKRQKGGWFASYVIAKKKAFTS
ncbi:MAG: hypothetical protein KDA92_05955 [Planctomycetales bacterium]|nr:hypothetical protein [Planctomycetales bacterium]